MKPEHTIRVLGEGRFLRLIDRDGWEFAERKNCTGVITIVAITEDERIVLVEQRRPALDARVIELPAGLVGDEHGNHDEAMEEAAQRELVEETGYEAESFEMLTEGPASAGMAAELIAFFRARGLKKVGEGGGVSSENITVHEVPLDDVGAWLKTREREGILIDPKVYAGLYFVGQGG